MVVGGNCDVVVVVVVVGGEENEHNVPLKNKYMAVIVVCF